MKEGATFISDECRVLPGTSLLMYTDGILEATNGHNEQFGAERLAQAFRVPPAPHGASAKRFSLQSTFAKGTDQADDISLCMCPTTRWMIGLHYLIFMSTMRHEVRYLHRCLAIPTKCG